MSNKAKIQAHSYKAHRDIVGRIAKAVLALDTDLKNMGWKVPDPAHREQYAARRRAETREQVARLRAELNDLTQADRALGRYTPDAPTGEALGRAQLYATQAAAELGGLGGDACLRVVQQVAASGDAERTAAYLTAARARVSAAGLSADLHPIERQVEPADARVHRAFGKAADEYWTQMGWFDQHLTEAMRIAERGGMPATDPNKMTMAELMGQQQGDAGWQGTRGLLLAQNDAEKAALRVFTGEMGDGSAGQGSADGAGGAAE